VNFFECPLLTQIKRPSRNIYLYLGRRMRHSSWFPERSGGACQFCNVRGMQLVESCRWMPGVIASILCAIGAVGDR
jgi:hypothetical protein